MSPRGWKDRIEDILLAADEIQGFIAGLDYAQFCSDPRTLRAVTADLMIIGEAAANLPGEFVSSHSEVPWRLMQGMRNRIVHAYFDVDTKIVWDTCREDLPMLIEALRVILEEDSDGNG
ncbi:MAG: DUF86 domain-containing protein [Planctomycetota bacterium]|nr:DUF86 domain-containing protein [Planctomycetota bacterium]MDA1137594.1 DUF86 domain-containing protein [Planctomycetota bacterium]